MRWFRGWRCRKFGHDYATLWTNYGDTAIRRCARCGYAFEVDVAGEESALATVRVISVPDYERVSHA